MCTQMGPYVAAKSLVSYKRSYDTATQEYLDDGTFQIVAEVMCMNDVYAHSGSRAHLSWQDGDENALKSLPKRCPIEHYA